MALLVLGDLGIAVGGHIAHDDRHFVKTRSNRCAQSLGIEVDAVAAFAIRGMHDEWLQDAAPLDVRGEFFERALGELGARVVRILIQKRYGYEHRPAVWDADLGRSGRYFYRGGRRGVRARGRAGGPVKRVRLWLEVEQIKLSVVGPVPRHAHKSIVPLSIDAR